MNGDKMNPQMGRYRPALCFYHANGKGTGSAVKLNLHPAFDDVAGCIMLTIANQMTVSDRRGPNPRFATFDWERAICVKLDFDDLSRILQVLRGECETINEGKGLYHRSARWTTGIRLGHIIEPVAGYVLDICRKAATEGEGESRARILFNAAEALGLCEAISGAMCLVGFGIPMLYSQNAGVRSAETGGVRNAAAA